MLTILAKYQEPGHFIFTSSVNKPHGRLWITTQIKGRRLSQEEVLKQEDWYLKNCGQLIRPTNKKQEIYVLYFR